MLLVTTPLRFNAKRDVVDRAHTLNPPVKLRADRSWVRPGNRSGGTARNEPRLVDFFGVSEIRCTPQRM